MRRRTKIIFLLGALVLLALGWVVFKPEKEPEYNGKKLSEWAMQLMRDPGTGANLPAEAAYEEAGLAIRAIGTNAVPHLVKWISCENPTWLTKFTETLNNFVRTSGLSWKIPYNPVPEDLKVRRRKAVIAFQLLGPVAESAIPALSQALSNVKEDDSERALSLATALAQLGPQHCVSLCAALTNQTFVVRSAALKVFSFRRDTNYAAAVPALVACLSDRDCRFDAIRALGIQHLRPELSLPALNLMLTNCDSLLRSATAKAIYQFEPEPRTNMQFLLLVDDFHILGPIEDSAAPNLCQFLHKHKGHPAAWKIATALGGLGTDGCMQLVGVLTNADATLRRHAAIGLEFSTNIAHAIAVPALLASLKDTDEEVATISASSRLLKFRPDLAIPALIEAVADPRPRVKQTAIRSLALFGTQASNAIPVLLEVLKSTNGPRQHWITNVIRRIDPNALPK